MVHDLESAPELVTIREIAGVCEVAVHRANYAVDTYHIEPRQRAGIIRLWHRDDIPRIASAIARIAERGGASNVR
jgi:hypothetical protein